MGKSAKHKEQNTFRFQSFSERIEKLGIKLGRHSSVPQDADTHFAQALSYWTDLNCTQHFVDFQRQVIDKVQSHPQLLHYKQEVSQSLQHHLQIPNSLALQPVLDLLVQFARDLQDDFMPFFEVSFNVLVSLLSCRHHDVDALEWIFTCIAKLFWFLRRFLVKDLASVYRLCSPLLSSRQYKDYINNFAAESFSFLMRKAKHCEELFDLMFTELKTMEDRVVGVAHVLFETIKMSHRQFFTCYQQIIPMLLTRFCHCDDDCEVVLEVLKTMWKLMAKHLTAVTSVENDATQHASFILNSLQSSVTSLHEKWQKSQSVESVFSASGSGQHFAGILQLVHIWVSHKAGILVVGPAQLVETLVDLFKGPVLPAETRSWLLQVISALLMSSPHKMEACHRLKLITSVYSSGYGGSEIFSFTQSLFDISLFEKDVLPSLIGYCQSSLDSGIVCVKDVLVMIVSLLQNKAPPLGGYASIKLFMCRYPLDFRTYVKRQLSVKTFPELLVDLLSQHKSFISEDCLNLSQLWMIVRCLPHVRPINDECVIRLLEEMLHSLCSLSIADQQCNIDMLLSVAEEIVISLGSFVGAGNLSTNIPLQQLCGLLQLFPSNISALRLIDSIVTCVNQHQKDLLTKQLFDDIFQHLEFGLSSPCSLVRLLTLHILSQFNLHMPTLTSDVVVEQRGVFKICCDAEIVSLSVLTDRERIRHLEKLKHEYIHYQLPVGLTAQVPLRYLVGQLSVNFKPLWQPVRELIKTYAAGMTLNDFWSIYGPALSSASQHIQQQLDATANMITDTNEVDSLFRQYRQLKDGPNDRPDYINFRHQLWTAMQEFPAICEPRSRIVVPLLFDFLEKEYFLSDLNFANSQDLRTPVADTTEMIDDDIVEQHSLQPVEAVTNVSDMLERSGVMMDDDGNEDDLKNSKERETVQMDNTKRIRRVTQEIQHSKRASHETLVLHLGLFSKFCDPMSLYRQQDLHALYLELLKSPSTKVQREAFKCLMTYKPKYLLPYSENFERLIADKSFRNELVLFSIDSENSVIDEEHRDDLLPVLMRILYGKMKSGKEVSSKLHGQLRKSTILGFVASSRQHEITMFFNLIFEPFLQAFSDDAKDSLRTSDFEVETLMKGVDVSNVIPLRKLLSMLNTIKLVLHKCGSLVGDYLQRLLRMIIYVAAYSSALLEHRAECSTKYVSTLKSLRYSALTLLCEFFTLFENYPFSTSEIDAIFNSAIWPQLERLSSEGVYSPTPLLKLLHIWSRNPRFVVLLSKCKPGCQSMNPVGCSLALLSSPRCVASVVAMVMDIVDNLLTNEDNMDELNDNVEPIIPGYVVELSSDTVAPFGTQLLMPHVPVILLYLHDVVKHLSSSAKNKSVPAQELRVLSRLSKYVNDSSQSSDIISLLLPFLGRRLKRSEDVEVDILTSIKNLISRCQMLQSPHFLHCLAELFSTLSMKESRKALCEVLSAAVVLDSSLDVVALISSKLNAWDLRHVEEPDLARRMEGFSEAKTLVRSGQININLLLVLVHNCTFLLSSLEGLSGFALRDQSAECLETIIHRVSCEVDGDLTSDLFRVVVGRHLLTQIKNNLKHKSETVRHAFIVCLESLVHHFPVSVHFSDLVPLCDDNDIEVDFFKNIVHVQLHRRMKALRRLGRYITSFPIRSESFVNYILPFVLSLLRDATFTKNSDRVDVAVETLGIICQYLHWPRYLIILRYCLTETLKAVENHKLAVKILITVLHNFHFNLQHSQFSVGAPYLDQSTEKMKDVEAKDEEQLVEDVTDGLELMAEEDECCTSEAKDGLEASNICSASLATRIHRTIVTNILPQLHKCLTKEAKSDGSHKLAGIGKYAEDEEILRVPVALALVKLLQKLPRDALDSNLPGVLMKVCRFLCSRAKDIRTTARDTLTKIAQSLGPSYFSYIVTEMRSALKRGYQLHVLCYSLWTILKNIAPMLQPGDLDSSIHTLTEIFNEELFGQVADEKEVEGIVAKLFEAKTTKSIDSYGILATVISKSSLIKLILPLKTELLKARSSRITKKVSDVLKLVGHRLVDNKGLELDYLLTFIYGMTSESVESSSALEVTASKDAKKKVPLRPPSALLLNTASSRAGTKAKSNTNTNFHILVEFGLQLLHLLLKHSNINATSLSNLQLLDPFVAILKNCLSSKHVKVVAASLRCLLWMLRLPLPSLRHHITSITSHLFILLNNYAGPGAGKGDNFELVVMCFKVFTVLVRHVSYHTVTEKQLHVLLVFIKQDLNDFTRQATAFSLLKSIISRKLVEPELEKIVSEVEQMSIVADASSVRQQCRQLAWQFMLDYPLGDKKLDNLHLEFYLQQLTYEHESGRSSALEMLTTIINTFPQNVLIRNCDLFFSSLVLRLINDEASNCRQMAAAAIKMLLSKVNAEHRDHLIDMCIQWMANGTKLSMLRMSAKAVSLFVEVESLNFKRHLMSILPQMHQHLIPSINEMKNEPEEIQQQHDLFIFDFLTLLLKIVQYCRDEGWSIIWCQQPWSAMLSDIWGYVEVYLSHPHIWIKFVSAQLFNELFTVCSPELIVSAYLSKQSTNKTAVDDDKLTLKFSDYLVQDLEVKLHSLCGAFCNQLSTPNVSQQLADQVVCNLLHLCRLLTILPSVSVNTGSKQTSLRWLIKRLVREVKMETSGLVKSSVKRKCVYQWLLGVAKILGKERIIDYSMSILRPLVREMTDSSINSDDDLKSVCQQSLDAVKQIIGNDEFSHKYAAVQQTIVVQRQQRKAQRSVEAVTNPELNARRKMNKNIKKQEAKKRRITDFRPSKICKKLKSVHDQIAETF